MLRETIEILERLISFDTSSGRSNRDLVGWIYEFLENYGVESKILPDPTGSQANLVARIGPRMPGGIVLCGHSDTVPADSKSWESDPFTLKEQDGRLYGRGTVDMKGFVACALAALTKASRCKLERPLYLALTYEEEIGCLGADSLAKELVQEPQPAAVIVGEATQMRLVRAHKGIRVFATHIVGREAHSSQPEHGISAIRVASHVITSLCELAAHRMKGGPVDEAFHPPYTTLNVGTIIGGTGFNVVPKDCRFEWEFRYIPDEDPDVVELELLGAMSAAAGRMPDSSAVAVDTQRKVDVPALDPATNQEAASVLRRIGGIVPGDPVPYGSDGAVLQSHGLPVVLIGPGEISQMHRANESIAVADLGRCNKFLDAALAWLAT